MKLIRLFLLMIASAAFITSCKKSVPAQIKCIPKDAVFVATIHTKSLQSKLEKNQVTIENIIKNISGSDTSVGKSEQEWQDLKACGIDLNENLYIAVVNKGAAASGGKGAIITSAIGSLKDAGKLEAYIKKKDPASEVRKEKEYSYTTIQGNKIVAWGHDVVIMMSYQKSFTTADMDYDSTTHSFNLRTPANAVNDMKAEIDSDFNLKEDQSIAAIPFFNDLMQEKADATMWVNSSASVQQLPLPLPKMKELFGNSYTAAKVDFDDGKIVFNSKSYYSSDLVNLLKEYPGTAADLSLIENYPSDNINGFAVFSFNPQLINGIVKYLEVGGVVDGYLSQMMGGNYTLPEALKAIKGDFAITVSDFSTQLNNGAEANKNLVPNLKMLLNVPVGDKVQMEKIMNRLVDMQFLTKMNGQYGLSANMQKFGYQLHVDDKNIFITSDENLLNQYKAKSKKANLDQGVMSNLKGKSGAFYINIESILNGMNAPVNVQGGNILPKAKETFKDVQIYAEKFNGKYLEGHGELRFKNEKENSLTSLLGFIETVSKNVKKDGVTVTDINDETIKPDTTIAPQPLPENRVDKTFKRSQTKEKQKMKK